jgi:hypothetical protein
VTPSSEGAEPPTEPDATASSGAELEPAPIAAEPEAPVVPAAPDPAPAATPAPPIAAPPPPPQPPAAASPGPLDRVTTLMRERPEVAIAAAFVGGLLVAQILKRLAR